MNDIKATIAEAQARLDRDLVRKATEKKEVRDLIEKSVLCTRSVQSLADILGVKRGSIGRWKTGESSPSTENVSKMRHIVRGTR